MTTQHNARDDPDKIARTLNRDVLPENAYADVEDVPDPRAVVRVDGLFESSVRKDLWMAGFSNEPVSELTDDVERSAIVIYATDES